MADVELMIGGACVSVPPLSFAALKRALPGIEKLRSSIDTFGQTEGAISIMAAALQHERAELTAEEIEERILPSEIFGLLNSVTSLLTASGLITDKSDKALGEAARAPARKRSAKAA